MYLIDLKSALLVFLIVISGIAEVSSQSVSVARWKNNSKAAYSIILDDYCTQYFGDIDFIDSTTEKSGINVTFALITEWRSCDNQCREVQFERARELFSKGHEFISHSATHSCTDDGWDLAREIDSSKAVIERRIPGNKALMFAFPCGKSTPKRLDYIKSREYIGARFNGTVNSYIIDDPFHVKNECYNGGEVEALNKMVDDAIMQGGWAVRQTHNVGREGGWEPIDKSTWQAHLNFLSDKMDNNDVWVAPAQKVLKYALERENWTASVSKYTKEQFQIEINAKKIINPNVSNQLFDEPLTLIVELPEGYKKERIKVLQGNDILPVKYESDTTIHFNAFPGEGDILVKR